MKSQKRRRFSNNKTRRIKRRGGMHKHPKDLTPKERAEAYAKMRAKDPNRNAALTAAQTALARMVSTGVSPGVRTDFLTRGTGALAGRVVGSILAEKYIPPKQAIKLDNFTRQSTMLASEPASMLTAYDIFQQAEDLCSMVRKLPHDQCWTTNQWGQLQKSELVKGSCSKARALYNDAVVLEYLPAYAPLAWMMSREDSEGSIALCDKCIAECDVRRDAASRKAKLDCTAIRAFADQESLAIMWSNAGWDGKYSPDPEFEQIMEESIKKDSKYGHAMKWLWLSTLSNEAPNPDEIAAQKRVAEDAGIDFDRCR